MGYWSRFGKNVLKGVGDGFNAMTGNETRPKQQRWSKYGKPTLDRDTGLHQTNYYEGHVGEKDSKKKVHVAINENGDSFCTRY